MLSRVLPELISCPGLPLGRAARQFHPSQERLRTHGSGLSPPTPAPEAHRTSPRISFAQCACCTPGLPAVLPDSVPLPAPKFALFPVVALTAAILRLPGEEGAVTLTGAVARAERRRLRPLWPTDSASFSAPAFAQPLLSRPPLLSRSQSHHLSGCPGCLVSAAPCGNPRPPRSQDELQPFSPRVLFIVSSPDVSLLLSLHLQLAFVSPRASLPSSHARARLEAAGGGSNGLQP